MQAETKCFFLLTPKAAKPLTDWNEEEVRHKLDIVNNFLIANPKWNLFTCQMKNGYVTMYIQLNICMLAVKLSNPIVIVQHFLMHEMWKKIFDA